jgi:hypothetical protein
MCCFCCSGPLRSISAPYSAVRLHIIDIAFALLQELRREIELMDGRGMKQEGPRLVARCWTDHAFKKRLLQVTSD